MLSKEEFVKYFKAYTNLYNYLNELADLGVDIYGRDEMGAIIDYYINLLCLAMGEPIGEGDYNNLEEAIYEVYDINDVDPEEIYDTIVNGNQHKPLTTDELKDILADSYR